MAKKARLGTSFNIGGDQAEADRKTVVSFLEGLPISLIHADADGGSDPAYENAG